MDSISIRLSDLRKFKGSLVYVVSRPSTGQVLYVGRSNVGIDRPLEVTHSAIKQCLPTDSIRLIFCGSASQAARLERKIIAIESPCFNIRKPAHKLPQSFKKIKGGNN